MSRGALVVWSVVLAPVVLGLALLAWTGGLRIRTPFVEMAGIVSEFDASGLEVVGTRTSGDRVCFLECVPWRYEVYLHVPEEAGGPGCDELERRARAWLGPQTEEYLREDPRPSESPCFYAADVESRPEWTAFAARIEESPPGDPPEGTDWVIEVMTK